MSQFSILQTANLLVSAFNERYQALELCLTDSAVQEGQDSYHWVARFDTLIQQLLHGLGDYPVAKWLSLCQAIEPNAILISAASHCKGCSIADLDRLTQQFSIACLPYNAAHSAAHFLKSETLQLKDGQPARSVDELFMLGIDNKTLALFLLAQDNLPVLAENAHLKSLHPDLAIILAYYWACGGLPPERREILRYWQHAPLLMRFWASFALILRDISLHDQIDHLVSLADDAMMKSFALGLKQAIDAGPLQPNEALELVKVMESGPVLLTSRHAIRLAMWLPRQAPLVKIGNLGSDRQQAVTSLRSHIKQAIADGIDFSPDHDQTQTLKSKPKIHTHLAHEDVMTQAALRGWTQQAIEQALQHPSIPLMAGEFFAHFHPQTGAVLVTREDKSTIIHLGRQNYLYPSQSLSQFSQVRALSLPPPNYEGCEWIAIPLKHETLPVWRPVEARRMQGDIFCIMPQQNPPKDEHWLYPVTAYVLCARRSFIGGTFLAAIKPGPMRI